MFYFLMWAIHIICSISISYLRLVGLH